MTESQIQAAIIRTFGTLPTMRIWRANTGAARFGNQIVRFGVPGQADLTGILPDGHRLEIEVKSATGRQSQDQANYQRMIERFGGVYILARSVSDVAEALKQYGINSTETEGIE